MEMGSVRLHAVQVVPSEALSDSLSHTVNKDGKTSSAEARPRATKVVSAGRSTGLQPLGMQAAPSPFTASDNI